MEKRYQVFVSSTFIDLVQERREVIQALLELNCIPAGMELFPASNEEKWALIKRVIDDCDYYVVIIGGRYGSTDVEGISYTEREYDYALNSGKPVLGFLHGSPGDIPVKFVETDEDLRRRLDAFREKVSQRMCKFWRTPDELSGAVSRSLAGAFNREPSVGWVRGDNAMTPEVMAELAELRAQAITDRAQRSSEQSPPGTEGFSQGSDEVEIAWEAQISGLGAPEATSGIVAIAWDDVFKILGPHLIDESSEGTLRNHLATFIQGRNVVRQLTRYESLDFEVNAQDFQQVKVQLIALGLMYKSDRKHGIHDKGSYWTLTPFGEIYLMRLLAIPRDSAPALPVLRILAKRKRGPR